MKKRAAREQFIRQLSKHELHDTVRRLQEEGLMPSLEELSEAVRQARVRFANEIRRARRDAREKVAVS